MGAQNIVDAQYNTNPQMILNDAGKMVRNEWLKLPKRFQNMQLHEYIIMPNHFHAILEIVNQNKMNNNDNEKQFVQSLDKQKGQPQGIAPTGNIIGAFKSITSVKYIRGVKYQKWQPFNDKLWQRNY